MPDEIFATAVESSKNQKTGTVHATYASNASCPSDCILLNAGCYAQSGPVGFTTGRLNRAAELSKPTPLAIALAEAEAITDKLSGKLDMRIHVVGDCTTNAAAATVSKASLSKLKEGNIPWSYTHAWRTVDRAAWGDVSILASLDSPKQFEEAHERAWATAIVIPEFESEAVHVQQGIKILPCPSQTRGTTCVECRLCLNSERLRKAGLTIGFTPHGSKRKTVVKNLTVLNQ